MKHARETRRKMTRALHEVYNDLLKAGCQHIDITIDRGEHSYAVTLKSAFDPIHQKEIESLRRSLMPEERNEALATEYWGLAGTDAFSGDNELMLVGHLVSDAEVTIAEKTVLIQMFFIY